MGAADFQGLDPYTETRPWGSFTRFVQNSPCTVKTLVVNPGAQLSRQRHAHRSEFWLFLDAGAVVEIDGEESRPAVGDSVRIATGAVHRLGSDADAPVRILEIGFGTFDEDDIERIDDVYGRA